MGKVAYEIPNLRFSVTAASPIMEQRFVTVDADGNGIQANATSTVIAVSRSRAENAGEVVNVADGIVMVAAAGAIVSGAGVKSDANGKAVTVGADETAAGVALTTGVADGLVAVKLI